MAHAPGAWRDIPTSALPAADLLLRMNAALSSAQQRADGLASALRQSESARAVLAAEAKAAARSLAALQVLCAEERMRMRGAMQQVRLGACLLHAGRCGTYWGAHSARRAWDS